MSLPYDPHMGTIVSDDIDPPFDLENESHRFLKSVGQAILLSDCSFDEKCEEIAIRILSAYNCGKLELIQTLETEQKNN